MKHFILIAILSIFALSGAQTAKNQTYDNLSSLRMADSTLPVNLYGKISDGVYRLLVSDPSTNAVIFMDYDHAEAHKGNTIQQ